MLLGSSVSSARAEDAEEPTRYLLSASTGGALRLTRNEDFDQNAFAPLYADLLVGMVPASASGLRHGFGLGASLNLTEEGGFTEPVAAGEQLVLMPAYLAYYELDLDFHLLGHLGVPLAFIGAESFGLELGAAAMYRLLAGVSLFGELSIPVFVGERKILHPSIALELGVLLDYEVLP